MGHALDHTARKRDAVRILFILDQAGTAPGTVAPAGAVSVIKAEKRLQALDFWVRSPDYLAAELVQLHEKYPEEGFLDEAFKVMQGDEPDIRRMQMMRFLFGAWEQIDDSMSQLISLGLATIKRNIKPDGKLSRTDFFLLESGRTCAAELADYSSHLAWYRDRAALVARVAGTGSGDELKARQYAQAEYQGARWNQAIGPIKQRVLKRLEELKKGMQP
ncbi:hypothetical protein SNE35_29670 [Paucibacter sp. R3-3]|uniref:Uncharacterized protein n=1 Tax=Roseateles agri TaxID=3098619 RepID=A0ABU5DRF6_9BURK|nr:hypothetical protein [Paucibacter sp. R3-3]MDY0748704.1 hypothetical protein [Paucibacter sp. R3-3]